MITHVISNLLDNSLKFTISIKGRAEGEKIIVTSDRKDNQVTVSINDTGAGIDPEILPRLFTKFASKSFAGTGLGLYISKSIIEEHGGKIWAENNADGRGATFHLLFRANNNLILTVQEKLKNEKEEENIVSRR